MAEAQGLESADEPCDTTGWPIRVGMRIKVRGFAAVPGGAETGPRTGEVLEVRRDAKHGWLIRFRDDESGSHFHHTIPGKVKVRKQTKEQREEMLQRARRMRAKAEGEIAPKRIRKVRRKGL